MRHLILIVSFLVSAPAFSQADLKEAQLLASKGKYAEAIQIYSSALSVNSNNKDALLGRGFTYSWNHDFANATSDFNTMLQKDPGNQEAQKGLAFVALWSGNNSKAIESFKNLISIQPQSKEFYIALGKAQMNEGLLKDARQSFQKAENLDPNDNEPKQLIDAARSQPTIFDIDILGGLSTTDGETKTGLRFVQINSQVSKQLQFAAKYDNTLSLDNLSLITNNRTIPYYAASFFYNWNRSTATKIEGGFRNIKDAKVNESSSESQFSVEQVVFLKKGKSIKVGGVIISPNSGQTALLLLAGYHQLLNKNITAGINYFYANRNVFNTKDADFHLKKGNTITTGFYYGKSSSDNKLFEGNIYGGFLKGYFPVSNIIGIHTGISAENNFLQNLFNLNVGIRLRLEK
jgi:Tetratricopeptide repeat